MDVKRLKDLERENATLKRFLADAELEKSRSEIANGNISARNAGGQPFVTCAGLGVSEQFACRDGHIEPNATSLSRPQPGKISWTVRGPATATGAAARIRTLLPPCWRPGHHGVPEPVFHDVAAAAASSTAPRPALPAIGTPLSIPFDCGATGRAALTSWASSIAAGVAPCQPAGTDSRPRVLASPIWADTLLAVNGAPLTPAVPPMGGSAAPGIGHQPKPLF